MTSHSSDLILFVQHGWADTNGAMARLGQRIAPTNTKIVAPNLGWWRTWWRMDPLVNDVEAIAQQTISKCPQTALRIVGHSMGGLIWLEILHRHPEWWSRVESLVLIGSPVGGSDLCRIMDPLAVGLGMARDLGKNRRAIASAIAAKIPTLSIASNTDGGSDGVVIRGATQFDHAHWLELPGIVHAAQRHNTLIDNAITAFWRYPQHPNSPTNAADDVAAVVIQQLRNVPGMTDGHMRHFSKAKLWSTLAAGLNLFVWKNPLRVDHVFLGTQQGGCLYSGFVGWIHTADLYSTLQQLKNDYGPSTADLLSPKYVELDSKK